MGTVVFSSSVLIRCVLCAARGTEAVPVSVTVVPSELSLCLVRSRCLVKQVQPKNVLGLLKRHRVAGAASKLREFPTAAVRNYHRCSGLKQHRLTIL